MKKKKSPGSKGAAPPKETEKIVTEITKILNKIDIKTTKEFVTLLLKKRHLFLVGSGRSGLIAQAFAMRLRQFGLESYVVGEVITPAIGSKDLVVAISGSGETTLTYDIVKEAKKQNTTIVLITAKPKSKVAKEADLIIELKTELNGKIEPLASLFEQSALIYLDSIILDMIKKKHKSFKELRKRHANI
ncbi:MAG: SIS domain-containing protein [Candidatus Pacearchaeota archaeon]|nr:MAG: SIS domain-containing protein [Candidatus Pacearchaeota archaeon]